MFFCLSVLIFKGRVVHINSAVYVSVIDLICGFVCYPNANTSFYLKISENSKGNEKVAVGNKYENSVQ